MGFVRNVMLGRDGLDRTGLLDAVMAAGGSDPCSYLTTGNVTFDAARADIDEVTCSLESAMGELVARQTVVAVRSHDWLRELAGAGLFDGFRTGDLELEIAFLPHTGPPLDAGRLPRSGRTRIVAVLEREVATARPRTGPDRPHVNRLVEAATGRDATARGWSTLCRIADKR